jgi:hypothetical protein
MSAPNPVHYDATLAWLASKAYADDAYVVHDNKIYKANNPVGPSASTPVVDTTNWTFVADYLYDEVEGTNNFKHWRETNNASLLAQKNQEDRLESVEKITQDILNDNIAGADGYSGTNTNLQTRLVNIEDDVANIMDGVNIGSTHNTPKTGLENRLLTIEQELTNLFGGGVDGADGLGTTRTPDVLGLHNRFVRLETDILDILSGVTIGSAHYGGAINGLETRLFNIEDAIANSGFQIWKGTWAAATVYRKGDVVVQGSYKNVYVALSNHTSAGSFDTDLTGGKWGLEVDFVNARKVYDSIKTASFVAVRGGSYMIDTLAGDVTVTLPSAPAIGDQVNITHVDGDVNVVGQRLFIARNSSNIMGFAEDLQVDKIFSSFTMVYSDSTRGWRITIL